MREKMKYTQGEPREKKQKTPEQALASLMRYASKAERSSGDALRLMRNWGIAEGDRERILARLREMSFIDDRRFAEAFVRDKVNFAGWGVYKIKAGLSAKGIPRDIADQALAAADKSDGEDRLEQILRRKAASLKDSGQYERRTRLVRFGLSRGYEYDSVLSVVEKIAGSEQED